MARDWSLVLDVGANQGDYAAEVQKVNPACRVVCFEPNRDLLPALQGRRIAEIHTTAVGDTGDNITIHINTADPSQSSLFRRSSDTVERRVPCVMLDDFCVSRGVERIDMVKIDTEGNETAVLRGMRHLIERSVADMIQFEYGGTYRDAGTSLKEAFDLLSEQYIVCRLCPQGLVPCAYGAVQEHYRYSNWVAVSRRLHGR
ncbi:MAG TPA: FkbM family methyltransferase [bacterium]|nr:FkbM family methyltransferase [bacterium]